MVLIMAELPENRNKRRRCGDCNSYDFDLQICKKNQKHRDVDDKEYIIDGLKGCFEPMKKETNNTEEPNSQSSIENNQSQEVPEFKNEYYWAFMALALYKIGNIETIPIEALEKFDAERDSPDIIYDPESKSFSLRNKEYEIPKKIVTAAKIPRKIRRNFLRNISRN